MKKLLIFLILICSCLLDVHASNAYINGYYRKNGTYVSGYNRTKPNSTKIDNYSTKGNINPYTSKKGYKNPYNTPKYNSINRRSW